MRLHVTILQYMLLTAFAGMPMSAQSGAHIGTGLASTSSADILCNEGRVICVSQSLRDSLISSPLKFTVEVNSANNVELDWELDDTTGQTLESGSTDNHTEPVTTLSPTLKKIEIRQYVFQPSKSDAGTLVLSPYRYEPSSGTTDLPKLNIPVRLDTATSALTILLPDNSKEYQADVDHSAENGDENFEPQTSLVPQTVTVMKIRNDDIMEATAETVLQSMQGQSPWHVSDFRLDGGTAHVKLRGEGWAGVSFYLRSVSFLIKKSLLQFPGIKQVVFD
jgi:hypothetical protein